jgi:hypothetical protein
VLDRKERRELDPTIAAQHIDRALACARETGVVGHEADSLAGQVANVRGEPDFDTRHDRGLRLCCGSALAARANDDRTSK